MGEDSKRWGYYEDDEEPETVDRVVRANGRYVDAPEPVVLPSPPQSKIVDPRDMPGMVVVPAFPLGEGESARVYLELWEQPGDVTLAVGYSTQQKLVEQLGSDQPWALLPTGQFQGLLQTGKVTALLLDPAPGAVSPRWNNEAVQALAQLNQTETNQEG